MWLQVSKLINMARTEAYTPAGPPKGSAALMKAEKAAPALKNQPEPMLSAEDLALHPGNNP